MKFEIAEFVGLFIVVIGCGLLIGAAALVSVALAVLVSGVLSIFAGILVVYAANLLKAKAPKRAPAGEVG